MSGSERQRKSRNASPASTAGRSSFYLAMRILAPEQREAMYAIYGFCRAVDDIADSRAPRAERLAKLEQWRGDLAQLYAGGAATDLTRALAGPIRRFGLELQDFLAVIEGMEMDVRRDIKAPDWDELDFYCDRVASAVGRLSVRVFGIETKKGERLSYHLGRALQLTNILRDLDQDAELGRLYLPKEALASGGIAEGGIAEILAHRALPRACEAVAERARVHYEQADQVMAACPRAKVRSPRVMGAVYRALLEQLLTRGFEPPRARVRPSKLQFAWAVLRYGLL